MASSVTGGGNPFVGGAQQRNLAPPGVGGAIGSANTRVSAPAAGVAPSQIKSARPNEGSNIGIPYSRLVPLNTSNKLFMKKDDGRMEWRTETEDLRATTVAFILGVRNKNMSAGRKVLEGIEEAPGYQGHNVAYQPSIMPGMPGTERFQQLCSLEYLQMYFEQVLADKTINLREPYGQIDGAGDADPKGLNAVLAKLDPISKSTGPVGAHLAAVAYAENMGLAVGAAGNPALSDNNTLLNLQDIAMKSGLDGSEAAQGGDDDKKSYQGIFARDFGPFLKGKGAATQLVNCTEGNLPFKYGNGMAQPFSVSRNAGDDLAFSVLDTLLMDQGFTDWRPDGIVLSKGVNDPSDKLSDEYLEARDGQLYNIRVQGPAITTSWTGERSLETLPLDKVFIVLVADCWFNIDTLPAADKLLLQDGGLRTEAARKAYNELREREFKKGLDEADFMVKQKAAYTGTGTGETTVLANFRLQVSTSSQMINHSTYSAKGNNGATKSGYKRPRLEGMSRMGLKLSDTVGEYVVGGWQMGQVLDTSASRAAMPQGSNIGVRTAPNSAALNVNVNVSWYTADRMCRSFNNAEGTVRTRFDGRKEAPKNPVNMQVDAAGFKNAVTAETAAKAKAAAAKVAKEAAEAKRAAEAAAEAAKAAAAAKAQTAK